MPIDPFLEHLRHRVGPALRVVLWYDEDDFGVLYVRDDIDPDDIAGIAGEHAARLGGYPDRSTDPLADRLGPEQATVQVREDAAIIRFPIEDGKGIAVGMEAGVARDLHEFVEECAMKLADADITFRAAGPA